MACDATADAGHVISDVSTSLSSAPESTVSMGGSSLDKPCTDDLIAHTRVGAAAAPRATGRMHDARRWAAAVKTRYDRPAATPEEAMERRARQVRESMAMTERVAAALRDHGRCDVCTVKQQWCICTAVKPLGVSHAVTILMHTSEATRNTATHRVMVRGLPHVSVRMHGAEGSRNIAQAYEEMTAECETSGRIPVILFPSADAIDTAEVYARATPAQRRAGLHIMALDGTWHNAHTLMKEMPPTATRLIVRPTYLHALFSPLRTQPQPGRVSTVEAVACAFDEWSIARRAALCRAPADSCSADSAAITKGDAAAATPRVGPDLWGERLRYHLMTFVDAISAQASHIGLHATSRGTGYRTWFIAPTSGIFSQVPAHLVCKIAEFAYGAAHVAPAGYRHRFASTAQAWRDVMGGSPDETVEAKLKSASHDDGEGSHSDITETNESRSAAESTSITVEPALDAAGAMAAEWSSRRKVGHFGHRPRVRDAQPRVLPPSTGFTRAPLWHACRDLFTLGACGFSPAWGGQRPALRASAPDVVTTGIPKAGSHTA